MAEKTSNKSVGEVVRPICRKCKKPMQLWATGKTVRHYRCEDCAESKLVDKEG